jgi:hypothetical protein
MSEIVKVTKKKKNQRFAKELLPDTKEARAYEEKLLKIKIHKDAL